MNFRKFLKQWFGFTRRERTGSIVLLGILLVVLVIRMAGSASGKRDSEPSAFSETREDSETEASPSAYELLQNPAMLRRTEQGESGFHQQDQSDSRQRSKQAHLLDLNRADSAELEALPGIGPVLAVRIIKYRYLLGYFHSVDQLYDVYGLNENVIEMNRHIFTCDTGMIRKIYINSASYSDLLRHPYINQPQVEAIVSYRRLSGPVTGISDLIRNRIFSDTELKRLEPYLEFK
ncbi:MAG TPA: hypothetical protein ENH59_08560 [Bacteroidetes bacterium]|nr:hypothetical protein [Bacteroidota bacterium]